MTGRLDDLIPTLSDPSIYPHHPDSIQVVQTHISVVFIAGELVYKIKKPLDLGFLDFTTLEKRKYFCQQEVRLNSRFSEGIYLGVEAIHEGPSGINLKGEGAEIEAAVLMRRIPHERLLIGMLHNNQVTPELLDRLADRLAYFHSNAAGGPQITSFGSNHVIYQNLKENFEQTINFIGRTIDAQTHEAVSTLATEFLEKHQSLFRERMERGFIRDCHGDLHLEHVVILDEIMLYDCIEFNDRFRYGDTAADLAFLLMDLDFRGYPAFADRIAGRYAEWSGDREILRLLGFYKSYRAFVRGKVEGFILDEPEVSESERQSAREVAKKYFALVSRLSQASSTASAGDHHGPYGDRQEPSGFQAWAKTWHQPTAFRRAPKGNPGLVPSGAPTHAVRQRNLLGRGHGADLRSCVRRSSQSTAKGGVSHSGRVFQPIWSSGARSRLGPESRGAVQACRMHRASGSDQTADGRAGHQRGRTVGREMGDLQGARGSL